LLLMASQERGRPGRRSVPLPAESCRVESVRCRHFSGSFRLAELRAARSSRVGRASLRPLGGGLSSSASARLRR
jgi:hypothetical protein